MPAGTALPRPVLNEPTRSLARLRAVEVLVGTNELANLTHPGRLRKSCSNNGNVHFRQVQSINPSTGSINFRSSDSRGVLAQARTLVPRPSQPHPRCRDSEQGSGKSWRGCRTARGSVGWVPCYLWVAVWQARRALPARGSARRFRRRIPQISGTLLHRAILLDGTKTMSAVARRVHRRSLRGTRALRPHAQGETARSLSARTRTSLQRSHAFRARRVLRRVLHCLTQRHDARGCAFPAGHSASRRGPCVSLRFQLASRFLSA